jgi:enterochelin esterase-like enzyme
MPISVDSEVKSSEPTCAETQGKVSTERIHSDVLPGEMRFSLYLPPCYSDQVEYPVLYMLHGLTFTDDQWIRLGLTSAADRMIANGEIKPLIMVFPYNPQAKVPPDANFGDALVNSLVPWVDSNYSTCLEEECRWIGGLSRGGGWAFYIFTHYPGVFGAVGGHSPALFTHDSEKMITSIQTVWNDQRIWMDVGDKDVEKNYLALISSQLIEQNIPNAFSINEGVHDEVYWGKHVDEYLRWYAGVNR